MVIICEVINVKDFLVNDLVTDRVTVIWNEEKFEDKNAVNALPKI